MTVEAAYQVKLLAALRSGDPALIHPFLAEIGKDRRSSDPSTAAIDTGAAALHLAVRCGSAETVALLLSHRAISPNGVHPPGSGTTALHLAASLCRAEVVSLLLEQPLINDTVRDSEGRTCRDVAKGRDVIKLIDDSRSFLNASYRSLLRSYILSHLSDPPSTALLQLLESPRASLVNLSYLDDASGSSLLHEAARRKDLRLIELAVRAGADVFVRNRRGKMAHEGTGKDDKVRVFLRQFANHDRTLIQTPAPMSEPPALKGYLNKYTNVAKGYNTRWFVLAHGVLSYYRHQDDESVTSRGSISMKNAILKPSDVRATRFEIHSYPSTGGGGGTTHSSASSTQKWYIRANHPVEAARWIQAITQSIEWSKRNLQVHQQQQQLEDNSMMVVNDARSSYSYSNTVAKRPTTASRKSTTMSVYGGGGGDADSINAALSGDPNLSDVGGGSGLEDGIGGGGGGVDDEDGEDEEEGVEDTSSADSGHRQPPHEAAFSLHANSTIVQLELVQELVNNVVLSTSTSTTNPASAVPLSSTHSTSSRSVKSTPSSTASTSSAEDTKQTLLTSINTLHTLLAQYTSMQKDREHWFKKQLASERARQSVWEESLATVVKEGAKLEEELRVRSRRRGSRVFGFSEAFREGVGVGGDEGGVGAGGSMGRRRRSGRYSSSLVGTGPGGTLKAPLPSVVVEEEEQFLSQAGETRTPTMLGGPVVLSPPPQPFVSARGEAIEEEREALRREDTVKPASATAVPEEDVEDGYDSADSDEFFDAIDSNNIPNLVVPPSLTSPPNGLALTHHFPFSAFDFSSVEHPFKGYSTLRTKLETADERPPTSLWSVLKHSIGKDLTKISFPVFFNEPTSMLQRMTEDMEFSECLDTAATQRDSLKRLAYVAAFAMSNYSSTIGRIAKPFNPMLSETFEYVRLDKKYHYVSEQVSHHPPVSTCWAESPLWHYFGEVDAQNKFMGKSFEIRPTGIVHVELVIPEEWVCVEGNKSGDKQHHYQHYPKAKMGRGEGEGKVLEHYTWKKVTTNVSGFILGSPTIDHYGDMLITNHRTGERCTLTFKPRGWRGKDAFEISGQVMDAGGRVVYEIAGRWNSQLIMREVGTGANGALHPDTSVASPSSSPTITTTTSRKSSTGPEYILLWKNSFKPPGSPFNLTPFAMSLNNCPKDTLRPYLAPTDCRLRPDQRAFELGKYDLANELKQRQEEKQRVTRKARETGEKEPHKPRWFVVETDGDTGERVWVPKRVKTRVRIGDNGIKCENESGGEGRVVEEEKIAYWAERERIWRAREAGELREEVFWKDVEEIFIEEPDEIRGI